MKNTRKILLVYLLILFGIIVWLGIIFLAPYLKSQSSGLQAFCYGIFSPLCHQNPTRSFIFLGYPLGVCARCLGIYFGFLAGTGLYPFLRKFSNLTLPRARIFILISLPIVIDATGNFLRLWMTPNWPRFTTGFIWGTILPFYFITGLADYFVREKRTEDFSPENIS
ncbi:MAG: DUF2085 domain-containing protein [Candidatus Aminicenantes bacterium]|nr:DUF2085 domain-containing protein [Candidatus Aminicenantes bacterium]